MANNSTSSKISQVWQKARIWECLADGDEDKISWVTSSPNFEPHFLSRCLGGAKCVKVDEEGNPEVMGRIAIEEDPVCSITSATEVDSIDQLIVFTAHKSGLVRQWISNKLEEPPKGPVAFKSDHKGPVLHLRVLNNDRKNNQLLTIGSDFIVKLWNVETRHCLSVLRGITSIPLCAELCENTQKDTCYFACGLVDGIVKLWRMNRDNALASWTVPSSSIMATNLVKHNSQVSCLLTWQAYSLGGTTKLRKERCYRNR